MDAKAEESGLAKKLDEELDVFLEEKLEKNKDFVYKDGFTADNFEEEINSHPLFMKDAPTQEQIDASPALQALQDLKYETEDPHQYAISLKEDGNYHFKKKLYKKAIIAYTEALKCKHDDMALKAVIFSNRAASNFYIGNNRSALIDASCALKAKPDHMKAIIRGATCCFDMDKYDDCIEWCDKGLQLDQTEKTLLEMRRKSNYQKKQHERDERKRALIEKKQIDMLAEKMEAIKIRAIRMITQGRTFDTSCSTYEGALPMEGEAPHIGKVYLDQDKVLHWPAYFVYPEFNQSDFIEDFKENTKFIEHMNVMFSPEHLPEWDRSEHYQIQNLQLYFKYTNRDEEDTLVCINNTHTLKTILSDPRTVVIDGCPSFIVVSKASIFFKEFTEKHTVTDF